MFSKPLLLFLLGTLLVLSCSAANQKDTIRLSDTAPASYTLATDCPEGDDIHSVLDAVQMSDTAGLEFGSNKDPFYGSRSYNSSFEFKAPAGVSASLLIYEVPRKEEVRKTACVGRVLWNRPVTDERLSFPLSAMFDTWGFHDYMMVLCFDSQPRFKHYVIGVREI